MLRDNRGSYPSLAVIASPEHWRPKEVHPVCHNLGVRRPSCATGAVMTVPGKRILCLSGPRRLDGSENLPSAHVEPSDPRIQCALALLESQHRRAVADIASELNLSVSRFRHLFTREMRISPTLYAKLARLEHARQLIKHSFLRIKEIAAIVGANDISHFVRDYKARFGQTPSEARKSQQATYPSDHGNGSKRQTTQTRIDDGYNQGDR